MTISTGDAARWFVCAEFGGARIVRASRTDLVAIRRGEEFLGIPFDALKRRATHRGEDARRRHARRGEEQSFTRGFAFHRQHSLAAEAGGRPTLREVRGDRRGVHHRRSERPAPQVKPSLDVARTATKRHR